MFWKKKHHRERIKRIVGFLKGKPHTHKMKPLVEKKEVVVKVGDIFHREPRQDKMPKAIPVRPFTLEPSATREVKLKKVMFHGRKVKLNAISMHGKKDKKLVINSMH